MWIERLAELLSGRVYNTIKALNRDVRLLQGRATHMETKMTENEQIIRNAALAINDAADGLAIGFQGLLARIDELEGITREDLTEELGLLNESITRLQSVGTGMTSTTVPASPQPADDGGVIDGGPIEHGANVPEPLAGESGPANPATPAPEENTDPVDVEPEVIAEAEPQPEPIDTVPAESEEHEEEEEEEDEEGEGESEGEGEGEGDPPTLDS